MPLEEDRITNLLYLVSQTKTIAILDNTSIEKKRTIIKMSKLGLLKPVGNNAYMLDSLGDKIVKSKKSYTQYLAYVNGPDYDEEPVSVSDYRTKRKRSVTIGIILVTLLIAGGLIYWFGSQH